MQTLGVPEGISIESGMGGSLGPLELDELNLRIHPKPGHLKRALTSDKGDPGKTFMLATKEVYRELLSPHWL